MRATPDEPRDFRLLDLPGYMAWSRRRLDGGESEAITLDVTNACCDPVK